MTVFKSSHLGVDSYCWLQVDLSVEGYSRNCRHRSSILHAVEMDLEKISLMGQRNEITKRRTLCNGRMDRNFSGRIRPAGGAPPFPKLGTPTFVFPYYNPVQITPTVAQILK